MTARIVHALLIAAVSLAGAAGAGAAEWLIICSGQSNMDGRAPVADLPAELHDGPANVTLYRWGVHDADKPQVRKPLYGPGDKQFGPEAGMIRALAAARPKDTFIIAKFAVGGTALWQWVPDYAAAGAEYKKPKDPADGHLYVTLKAGLLAVAKLHPQAMPVAACWLQGESDTGARAKLYLPNLRKLVANLRRDLGAPRLPFIAAEPADGEPDMYAAYQTLVGEDRATTLIACRTLAHQDKEHYNAASQLTIGGRFAEEIVRRLPRK